jgi:hypothetical protein
LVEVETESGLLTTTGKQPLCLSCGCSKPAAEVKPGEELLRWKDGKSRPTKILGVKKTDRLVQVFNLVLEDQEFYICDGFQVRSKPPLTAPATAVAAPATEAAPPEPSRAAR